jgi:small subunit ribosomal protein S5
MLKANTQRIKGADLELKEKVVSINRVVKTTKGGRAFSFSAIVVVGNENGVVGHGLGKAKEVQEAILKGMDDAKKKLINIHFLHLNIPHEQCSKYVAAKFH